MFKVILILVKKEMIETLSNKKKLWPFLLALIPIYMFFYTKGSKSLLDLRTTVYYIPVLVIALISLQLSSTSLLNEKNSKMLDVLLAMKVRPILIVLAKNIFTVFFAIIIGIIILIITKIGSIYTFGEDLLIISSRFLFILISIAYLSSVISFLVSSIVREISVIPIIAATSTIIVIGISLKIVSIFYTDNLSEQSMFTSSILLLLINIILTLINTKYIKSKKFLINI